MCIPWQISVKTSVFITETYMKHEYMLELNVKLNHDTIETLEKYTAHV